MNIRFAKEDELDRVNELREQVNDLHSAGKPEIFRTGFSQGMRDFIYDMWNDPEKKIVVAELDGVICGYAVIHHVKCPENIVKRELDYLEIDEFGVDRAYQRRGAGTEMIAFIRGYASETGLRRIELNMWEFNSGALEFYERAGFTTYRRYMEMSL